MEEYFHSVRLDTDKCKGCVNCIKRCPTEAIRIRRGKALILESRCIDCGECIRHCPSHAKNAVTDSIADLEKYKYNIALPAPALYAQFSADISIDKILEGLLGLGFNEVYEVARAAEAVSDYINRYFTQNDISKKPVISSACPAVVRLIQVKYPELIDHLLPIDPPVEVAARHIRRITAIRHAIDPQDIGVWFITPCPAKVTTIRQPIGIEKSNLSGAIGISKIFGNLLKKMSCSAGTNNLKRSTFRGQGWAIAGGESSAAGINKAIVVDDIQAVSEVLEQVTLGKLKDIDYIECLACAGGCVGGPLTVENRFVAEQNMKKRLLKAGVSKNINVQNKEDDCITEKDFQDKRKAISARPIMMLDEDILRAMEKLELMEKTIKKLPGLDCGSCGSPNCKALAEDIVQGSASETDCVFRLRQRVKELAEEMVALAQKLPPSLRK